MAIGRYRYPLHMRMQISAAASSVATIDPLIALLVGAFGAALLTVIGGLIGAWIQSVRDHRKWLRERRFEAYRDFMINMSQLSNLVRTKINIANAESVKSTLHALSDEIVRSSEAVSMLGPRSVNAAGQDWVGAALNLTRENSDANRESMRQGRWKFLTAVGKELGSKNVGDAPPVARPL